MATHLWRNIFRRSFLNPAVPVPSRCDHRLPSYSPESAPGSGRFRSFRRSAAAHVNLWRYVARLCRVSRARRGRQRDDTWRGTWARRHVGGVQISAGSVAPFGLCAVLNFGHTDRQIDRQTTLLK